MQDRIKLIASNISSLSLSEALELRQHVEQHIAVLALKSLSTDHLDTLDGSANLANANSLMDKMSML